EVVLRLTPAQVDDLLEVIAQALGGGDPAVPVPTDADELDRPALELGIVLARQTEDASDDLHREREGVVAHQVDAPGAGEPVDELVAHRADKLLFPAGERLVPEGLG